MVMTDVAGRRDVLTIGATTDVVFVRFVGNLGHPSDRERLKQWVITLSEWVDSGIQEIYFFLHHFFKENNFVVNIFSSRMS